jgi:hypothetical protein
MVSRFGSYGATRSHLGFLPGRRIGVVTQATGGLGSPATDILAAFAYDLERGDPHARDSATARLQRLIDRRPGALAEAARADSARASRRAPLRRLLSDLAGSYRHAWYGTVTLAVHGDTVDYRWGALHGTAEVVDARYCRWFRCTHRNGLLIDAGGTQSVEFDFPPSGPATAIKLRDEVFSRAPRVR